MDKAHCWKRTKTAKKLCKIFMSSLSVNWFSDQQGELFLKLLLAYSLGNWSAQTKYGRASPLFLPAHFNQCIRSFSFAHTQLAATGLFVVTSKYQPVGLKINYGIIQRTTYTLKHPQHPSVVDLIHIRVLRFWWNFWFSNSIICLVGIPLKLKFYSINIWVYLKNISFTESKLKSEDTFLMNPPPLPLPSGRFFLRVVISLRWSSRNYSSYSLRKGTFCFTCYLRFSRFFRH